MADLRSIDGGKTRRAKRLAKARLLRCPKCDNPTVIDQYVGRMVDANGRTIFKGTRITVCGRCGEVIE